jgi:hypothetical protein
VIVRQPSAERLPSVIEAVMSLWITSTPPGAAGCVNPTTSLRKLRTRVVRVLAGRAGRPT